VLAIILHFPLIQGNFFHGGREKVRIIKYCDILLFVTKIDRPVNQNSGQFAASNWPGQLKSRNLQAGLENRDLMGRTGEAINLLF
jgi:hypothetical protein